MKITIYGTDCCSKCNQVLETTKELVKELNLDVEIEKINDPMKAVEKGIMSLPALAVNGEVKIKGRTADKEEIKEVLNVSRHS